MNDSTPLPPPTHDDTEIHRVFAEIIRTYINHELTWDETLEVLSATLSNVDDHDWPHVERWFEMLTRGMVYGITTPETIH
jgi:hypothetical protein